MIVRLRMSLPGNIPWPEMASNAVQLQPKASQVNMILRVDLVDSHGAVATPCLQTTVGWETQWETPWETQ
jgi:hypothetical protein